MQQTKQLLTNNTLSISMSTASWPATKTPLLTTTSPSMHHGHCGEAKQTRSKLHDCLGITFELSTHSQVKIHMKDFIKPMLEDFTSNSLWMIAFTQPHHRTCWHVNGISPNSLQRKPTGRHSTPSLQKVYAFANESVSTFNLQSLHCALKLQNPIKMIDANCSTASCALSIQNQGPWTDSLHLPPQHHSLACGHTFCCLS